MNLTTYYYLPTCFQKINPSMHIPVLLNETIEGLNLKEGGVYVDCTVNRAGHSKKIAETIGKKGVLVCIDLDKTALKEAESFLKSIPNHPKLHFVHSNFRHLPAILESLNIHQVDGVLADLGISSDELDKSGRGFSFRFNEPLQMTFNSHPTDDMTTAYDIVNFWSEGTIADILYGFADEKYSRRIASNIAKSRLEKEIKTTQDLCDVISDSVPIMYRHRKTHFATKTFQALRMAVNDELGSATDLIDSLQYVLKEGGRACIITFHSTEDRIVKQSLKSHSEFLKPITKKSIKVSEEEINNNPRARSAQLRIVEHI